MDVLPVQPVQPPPLGAAFAVNGGTWLAIWVALLFCILFQTGGWLHSYLAKTEKWFDIYGGVNFLLMIPVAYLCSLKNTDLVKNSTPTGNPWSLNSEFPPQTAAGTVQVLLDNTPNHSDGRKIAFVLLFLLSRGWLLGFLGYRAFQRQGDSRFSEIKTSWWKFLITFMMQALWVYFVSLPLLVVIGNPNQIGFRGMDVSALIFFLLGLGLQVWADVTKLLWVKNGREGVFCQSGPWAFSRHPNYFGEIVMWWAAWGFTWGFTWWNGQLSQSQAPSWFVFFAWLSPAVTTILLLFVSGLPTAEGESALERYYEEVPESYRRYRKSTLILAPFSCLGFRNSPLWVRRWFCCEWPMYEFEAEDEQDNKLTERAASV